MSLCALLRLFAHDQGGLIALLGSLALWGQSRQRYRGQCLVVLALIGSDLVEDLACVCFIVKGYLCGNVYRVDLV